MPTEKNFDGVPAVARPTKPPAKAKPNGEAPPEIVPAKATRGGSFIAAYEPIYYALDGILPSGFLYGVTARRGGGKTAGLIKATCAVMKGDKAVMGCEVEPGRVAQRKSN
ncbi:MAG TPA: hypothetical protein VIL70_09355 [Chthoniobacterales bacterium]